MTSTAASQPNPVVEWQSLKGRRVVLDDHWAQERGGRRERDVVHQGVVTDVHEEAGKVALTLTRYDGRTIVLHPLGGLTVTDDATGTVLYTPAVRVNRRIPEDFLAAVRHVAPERCDDADRIVRDQVGGLPVDKALELVAIAGEVEWECTRDRDLLDDADSPAGRWAQAARSVARSWAADAGLETAE
ncbi:hypothetical protein [Streptomyces sp. VRA16 Mangrove soil]|uniref:hypothetical protein n=1 Tax=Streptomyces sp. VRA16 Mangrove soil TaxID=2817434 RepID=UPI001A9EE844|nr:hypothetical protein [Streptomyces sp. VRA16 Mangrove soil]MBO1332707.1 hypothetical protein [Streptomyces sp. VRA16 Mangrove soil]